MTVGNLVIKKKKAIVVLLLYDLEVNILVDLHKKEGTTTNEIEWIFELKKNVVHVNICCE